MVSTGVMVLMGVLAVLTAVIPAGVMTVLRRRGGKWKDFLVGALTFFLFAMVLESLFHQIILLKSPLGPVIQGNIWLYGLYGALAAGVFEETGRLIAFRLALRGRREPVTALSCGIGHGGCEAFLLLGLTYLSNLVLLVTVRSGGEVAPELSTALEGLTALPATTFLWAGFERLAAMTFHTANSVLVFAAATRPGKRWLFPAAILTHFLLDFIAVISNAFLPIAATELLTAAFAAGTVFVAARVYKNLQKSAEIS